MKETKLKEEPIVHPCEAESVTTKLWRVVDEMDFVGQERARKFC